MEERRNIFELSTRFRKICRICGEPIMETDERSFYTDGLTSVHMNCYFEQQKAEEEEYAHAYAI